MFSKGGKTMTTPITTRLTVEQEHLDLQIDRVFDEAQTASPPHSKPELTRILRWSGGGVLTVAAIAFMCQGVYSFAPMTRHWIMLAICGLLGLLGVVTGTLLKEEKGARAFLGFAAASFPVLASQLGAMFFSLFGRPPIGMPQPLVFSLLNSSKVMAVASLTLAIVVPMSYLAFRILARSQAILLTGAFTLANLCILVPAREGMWVSAIITAVACSIYWVDCAWLRKDFRLASFEGRGARLMLTGPLMVMIGRTFFYTVGSTFYGLMLGLSGAYLAFHWGRVAQRNDLKKICQLVGIVGIIAGWVTCLLPILDKVALGDGMTVYLILLPIAAILGAQSLAVDGQAATTYRSATAIVVLLNVVFAHWVEAAPMVSIVGLAVAIATVAAGTLAGEKPVFVLGLLTAAMSLGNFCLQAFKLHSSYAWLALALIGITVIFSASLIEKGSTRSLLKGTSLWGRLKPRSS
jgi:hypothetical protein